MIIVLADDFSGAAEVAGVATQYGLTAEVHIDGLYPSDADMVAIDADTRSLAAKLAAGKSASLAREIERAFPSLFYKKIDSVLRGPIVDELLEIGQVLGTTRTLLVNANPRKGRVVRDGQLYIDSTPIHQTQFARDPEFPACTADVRGLLQDSDFKVAEPDQFEKLSALGSYVFSVQDTAQLRRIALRCLNSPFRQRTLMSGAAEFFEALLLRLLPDAKRRPFSTLVPRADTLLISGTRDQTSSAAIKAVYGETHVNAMNDSGALETAQQVCGLLNTVQRAILTASDSSKEISAGAFSAGEVHERLMEVSSFIMANCKPQHVWLEGGRTASSFVRTSNWDVLKVEEVFADGVVGLKPNEAAAPQLLAKPGSYLWPISVSAPTPTLTPSLEEFN